jgi:hypothetical protein
VCAAHQPHEVPVAGLVLDQERQPVCRQHLAWREVARTILAADSELAARDRLDAALGRVLGELQRAEQVVAVGDRDRRHRVLLGERDDPVDLVRPLRERIGGPHLQMDEIS